MIHEESAPDFVARFTARPLSLGESRLILTRNLACHDDGEQKASTLTTEETEFPASIGKVAPRELAVHGVTQFEQLADWSESELLDIHGVGPKAIRILRDELRSRGMSFKGE